MTRTLFLNEFKRALFQTLTIAVSLVVICTILGHAANARPEFRTVVERMFIGTPDLIVDALLSLLMVLSGYISGAAAFSRINENHISFVHSLPIPRSRLWLTIMLANLGAVALTFPIMVLLRPSLWVRFSGTRIPVLLVILYLLLFAAGCCFIMLFRNLLISAAAGGLVLLCTLFEVTLLTAVAGAGPASPDVWGIRISDFARDSVGFWVAGSFILVGLYFALSALFFQRGEFDLGRTRLRNWSLIAVLLVAYPMLLSAGIDSGLISMWDRWALYPRYGVSDVAVSEDGKYLAVVERRENHPLFSRTTIVDIENGHRLGSYKSYGVITAVWSKASPTLNLITVASPLRRLSYALPPSDSIVRLSPRGDKLGTVPLPAPRIASFEVGPDGRLIFVVVSGHDAHVVTVDHDGFVKELLKTEMTDSVSVQATPTTNLVRFFKNASVAAENLFVKGFQVDGEVQEIPWSALEKDKTHADYLFDHSWASSATVQTELQKKFPLPGETSSYLLNSPKRNLYWVLFGSLNGYPSPARLLNNHVFSVAADRESGQGRLFIFDRQAWRPFGDTSRILPNEWANLTKSRFQVIASPYRRFAGISLNSEEGLAGYFIDRGSQRDANLYDAELDQSVHLMEAPSETRLDFAGIDPVNGLEGHLVSMARDGSYMPSLGFVYRRRREIKKVDLHPGELMYMDNDGNQIYRYQDQVLHYSTTGAKRRLWPLQ